MREREARSGGVGWSRERSSRSESAAMDEPFAITKREAFRRVGSPKIVQRWMHHRWVKVVRQGGRGRETLIDFASLKAAYRRYAGGDAPPLLPSEQPRSSHK